MDAEKLSRIALTSVKQVGAVRFRLLLEAFGSAQAAWAASPAQWQAAGLPPAATAGLVQARQSLELDKIPARLAQHGVRALVWEDAEYPRRLRELEQAPPVLYLRGDLLPEDDWAVAIVGSREVTTYGRRVAEELAAFLARHGVTVVSGLARGVDALAHTAALRAGGRTLAVLAHGLDSVYPTVNRPLAEEMTKRGAILSDYALGTPPDAANFPPRNRIISGLSQAVVVIEAGERSGALITAGFAAEQGREVFAVPGPIYATQSKGCNLLIERGAHPLLQFETVLKVLNMEMMDANKEARQALPQDATEAALYQLLGEEPLHLNEIGARAALPIAQVSSTLTVMELKGLVRHMGGMTYVVARELGASYG